MTKKSKPPAKATATRASLIALKLRVRQAMEQAVVARAVAKDAKGKLRKARKLARQTRKEAKRLRKAAKELQAQLKKATMAREPAVKTRVKAGKKAAGSRRTAVRPDSAKVPVLSPDPTPPTQELPLESSAPGLGDTPPASN